MSLTSLLVLPEQEDIHGPNFSDLVVIPVEPQDLLAILPGGLVLHINGGAVVAEGKTREGQDPIR